MRKVNVNKKTVEESVIAVLKKVKPDALSMTQIKIRVSQTHMNSGIRKMEAEKTAATIMIGGSA